MTEIKNPMFYPIFWKLKHILIKHGLGAMYNLHAKYGHDELRYQLDSFYVQHEKEFCESLDSFSMKVVQRFPQDFQEQCVNQLTEIGMLAHAGFITDPLYDPEFD